MVWLRAKLNKCHMVKIYLKAMRRFHINVKVNLPSFDWLLLFTAKSTHSCSWIPGIYLYCFDLPPPKDPKMKSYADGVTSDTFCWSALLELR